MHERTAELRETQLEIIQRLAAATESRDEETGLHLERIGLLCERVGLVLGLSAAEAETCAMRACCTTWARSPCPTPS